MLFLHLLLLALGNWRHGILASDFAGHPPRNRDIVAGEISKPGTAAAKISTKRRLDSTESRHAMKRPLPPMDFEAFGG